MPESSPLVAPQLVINSRMIYSSWIPADPEAAARLLPAELSPAANRAIFMNQYVVDHEEQTSGFGSYSLTYMGLDIAAPSAPDGVTPGRFFTHYLNSSERIRAYAAERGVPAAPGATTLELHGDRLVATTSVDGKPIADDFETLSIEFLDPSHSIYALRPKSPLEVVAGSCWYSPRDSFVYPGGEFEVTPSARASAG